MAINLEGLINLQGNKIPTDARSYSTFVYGYPKLGKSTFINDLYGEKVLFIATEHRHEAIANAHVVNVDSWAEFLKLMRLLKKPELQAKYDAICIDTVTRLESYCEQYVLSELEIDDLSDADWGKGFSKYNKELEKGLSLIEKSGYVPNFISHAKTETRKVLVTEATNDEKNKQGASVVKDKKDGKQYLEYQKIVPDVKTKFFNMINRIADNILYLDKSVDKDGNEDRKVFYRDTVDHLAGATYKGMVDHTELSPDAYVKAVEDAIKSEGKGNIREGEKTKLSEDAGEYNFKELMKEVATIGKKLQSEGKRDLLDDTIEKVLGKGKKVKDLNEGQAIVLANLVDELKELV